jgi:hypothetical protein
MKIGSLCSGYGGRTRYRFLGRRGDLYVWLSVRPLSGDSRHEEISCPVSWFWDAETARSIRVDPPLDNDPERAW